MVLVYAEPIWRKNRILQEVTFLLSKFLKKNTRRKEKNDCYKYFFNVLLSGTFRSVRIFSIHVVTTTMPSTVSEPKDDALRDNSFITDSKTTNVMGFRGFSNFLRLLGGD